MHPVLRSTAALCSLGAEGGSWVASQAPSVAVLIPACSVKLPLTPECVASLADSLQFRHIDSWILVFL